MSAVLQIDAVYDAAKAVAGFKGTGAAAAAMGREIGKVADVAKSGASRIARAADASDGLASKSSQATGGLGALAGGLEAVGATNAAAALQTAAVATDFFSGVGDIANLMLSTQRGQMIATKAAALAGAAASRVAAAGQWALNAAMSANPIALVILAIVALVAIFVIAYKKSETFRRIVDGAFRGIKAAVGLAVSGIVGYFRLWWTVVSTVVSFITGGKGLGGVLKNIRELPGKIKSGLGDLGSLLTGAGRDLVRGLIGGIKDMAADAVGAVTGVVGDAVGKAKSLLGINSPSRVFRGFGINTVQGLVVGLRARARTARSAAADLARGVVSGFGAPSLSVAGGGETGPGGPRGGAGGSVTVINNRFTVNGAVDKTGTARELKKLTDRRARRIGG